jgi:hypothetical protein
LANLADLGKTGNLLLNTEKKDIINHSAILDETGNTIISEGPGKNWIKPKGTVDHYLNSVCPKRINCLIIRRLIS